MLGKMEPVVTFQKSAKGLASLKSTEEKMKGEDKSEENERIPAGNTWPLQLRGLKSHLNEDTLLR